MAQGGDPTGTVPEAVTCPDLKAGLPPSGTCVAPADGLTSNPDSANNQF